MEVELESKADELIEVGWTVTEVDASEEFEAVDVATAVEVTL